MSEQEKVEPIEDLFATKNTETTVEGVDMLDDDWLKKASAKTNAVSGGTYVRLDNGLLTVDQINRFLKTMPVRLIFADENNEFIYYSDPKSELKDTNRSSQLGDPLQYLHPERALKGVQAVINELRTGKTDFIAAPVPGNGPKKHNMHYYKAMRDDEGNYRGINEWIVDIWPIVESYLKMTDQKLVEDPNAQVSATTGASQLEVDGISGASKH